jgi:hypothetical protein
VLKGNVRVEILLATAGVALRGLVDAYALACDQRDGTYLTSLFTQDASLTVHWPGRPPSTLHAPDGVGGIPERLARYDQTFHFVGNHLVRGLDGESAKGDAYCMAHHIIGAVDTVMAIHYEDRYAFGRGVWRFARRDVRIRWIDKQTVNAA